MFVSARDQPCTGCTHLLDCLDSTARHVLQVASFYVVARSPLHGSRPGRGSEVWRHLRFLSSAGNSYTDDYFGKTVGVTDAMRKERGYKDGENWDEPMINVFRKGGDAIRHSWGGELLYVQEEPAKTIARWTPWIRCGACSI